MALTLLSVLDDISLEECCEIADDSLPLEKGMNMLGIRSIKTFEKLFRHHWRYLEDPAAVEKMLNEYRAGIPMGRKEIQGLLETKKELNAERGRVNRLSAMKKRKPVK